MKFKFEVKDELLLALYFSTATHYHYVSPKGYADYVNYMMDHINKKYSDENKTYVYRENVPYTARYYSNLFKVDGDIYFLPAYTDCDRVKCLSSRILHWYAEDYINDLTQTSKNYFGGIAVGA